MTRSIEEAGGDAILYVETGFQPLNSDTRTIIVQTDVDQAMQFDLDVDQRKDLIRKLEVRDGPKLRLEIALDNAAFADDPHELPNLLRKIADQVQRREIDCSDARSFRDEGQVVLDSNGNRVGDWSIR